ncbi:monocarboxylate transporter 10 [Silurus asotus]|uniref:Monocarboxylate transporter 10 n=1 Tax=Silurus asotus TaxID=30991 RepID=A0AAD5A1S8_SILAS|nr:monocarboxylate transporter 10 [Silurus asotus]
MTEDKPLNENHEAEAHEETERTVLVEEPEVKLNSEHNSLTDMKEPEVREMNLEEKRLTEPEEVQKENGVDVELHGTAAVKEHEYEHPEGGWGWVVMLASMWCNGAVFGIQNAFGILFVYLLKEFGSENDDDLRFKTGITSPLP